MKLFAYGTLRPGGHLHALIGEAVLGVIPARATGQMYLNSYTRSYPLAVFGESGEIFGDLLLVKDHDHRVESVVRMERRTGYSEIQIPITLQDGTVTEATAFHWPHKHELGERIESGNWFRHRASR